MAGQLTLNHCTLFILELIFFTFYFQYFNQIYRLFLQTSGFFLKFQALFVQSYDFICMA
jgi:hypothetical protein